MEVVHPELSWKVVAATHATSARSRRLDVHQNARTTPLGRSLMRRRLKALDTKPAVIRYQRDRPGELIHIDIKKLGRIDGIGHRPQGGRSVSAGASAGRRWRRISGDRRGHKRGTGWEFLHVCIDD